MNSGRYNYVVRLFILFIIATHSLFALADEFSNLSLTRNPTQYSNTSKFRAYSKHSVFGLGSSYVEFPTLKNPVSVRIGRNGNSVQGFSHPDLLRSKATNPKYFCHFPANTPAELVFMDQNYAAVRVDCPTGAINGKAGNDVVFVPLSQVERDPDPDHLTEASAEGLQPSSLHRSPQDDLDEVVRVMMAEEVHKPVGPRPKSAEEFREFMMMNCTPYQPDYALVYSKLFEIAGDSLQVAYFDHNRKTEAVDRERSQFLSKEGQSNDLAPHLIRASPPAMNCIARQESRWDRYARSPTGAMGIGQQTSINVEDLRCFVYGCNGTKAQQWARSIWDEYHDLAEQQFPRDVYPELYYFHERDSRGNIVKDKNGNPTRVECDRNLTSVKRVGFCPISSIGATGLYQVIVERDIRQTTPIFTEQNRELNDLERMELSEVLATSHNAGRTVARLVAKNEKVSSWGKTMSKLRQSDRGDGGKEVRHYHQIMSNCLKNDHTGDFSSTDGIRHCRQTLERGGFRSHLGLQDKIMRRKVEPLSIDIKPGPSTR